MKIKHIFDTKLGYKRVNTVYKCKIMTMNYKLYVLR